mmetsp:Transcript_28960/g.46611  ORF Transcript_28960/g.46611 Transcript_28960/m.46611 type:complete len:88 (-) Transcript_28960:1250-1513(-)
MANIDGHAINCRTKVDVTAVDTLCVCVCVCVCVWRRGQGVLQSAQAGSSADSALLHLDLPTILQRIACRVSRKQQQTDRGRMQSPSL